MDGNKTDSVVEQNVNGFSYKRTLDLRSAVESTTPLYSHVGFLGAAFRKGQPRDGTQNGPALIRDSELSSQLKTIGVTMHDHGDYIPAEYAESEDEPIHGMLHPRTFLHSTLGLAKRVESILCKPATFKVDQSVNSKRLSHDPLLIVGGDHSLGTGSILGHLKVEPDLCVIWVDAHADINRPMTSSSGNIHGMPVAFLMKQMQDEIPWIPEFREIDPGLDAGNIAYIGLRSVDEHERYDLEKHKIAYFGMSDVDRLGIETVIRQALAVVNPKMNRPIHLSFDIDALDPAHAPSTGTSVDGGLTLREGLRICECVHATGLLSVMELVELNPSIGTESDVERTQKTAVELIWTAFGYQRCGNFPMKVHTLASFGIKSKAEWIAEQKNKQVNQYNTQRR